MILLFVFGIMLIYSYTSSQTPKKISLKTTRVIDRETARPVCILSTTKPNKVNTISNLLKKYYPRFDLVVVDPKHSILGAWRSAYRKNKFKYNIFMFLNDNLLPNKLCHLNYNGILKENLTYSLDYSTTFGRFRHEGKNMDKEGRVRVTELYDKTDFQFVADTDSADAIEASKEAFFIANSDIAEEVLRLADSRTTAKKETILDKLILNKAVGLMLDKHATKRISLLSKFLI